MSHLIRSSCSWFQFYVKIAIQPVLIVFILLSSIEQPCYAQQKKATNTLLWEISGKGLSKPSYLFGTYHFADKGFIDTMKTVNEKLNAADAVVGELIMDSSMAMKLLPYMMLKDKTLDQLFTASEYQLIADYLKKEANFELKNFNLFKPMAVQTIIIQSSAPKTFTESNPAIDQYFQDYGKLHHKQVLALETLEEQAEILFGGTLDRQKELLLKSVKDGEKDKKQSLKIYQLYIAQNLRGLEKFFTSDTSFTPDEMAKLLTNRNAKWITELPSMMQNKSLFIAIGAGHLVGKDGLIKGLQAQGYTVRPLATN
jgi:uncharacterized protein YbaP (TraB family)